jgi:hypothetical protein
MFSVLMLPRPRLSQEGGEFPAIAHRLSRCIRAEAFTTTLTNETDRKNDDDDVAGGCP